MNDMAAIVGSIPFIDGASIARATPMPLLIEALRQAFAYPRHDAPIRLNADMTSTKSLLLMPAWKDDGRLGTKIVTIDALRRPSISSIYLLMEESGRPLALFDGARLTRRRTAAASVLAAQFLARPNARSLLILGTGALVAPLIEAYFSAFALERIRIWGRNAANADRVAAEARCSGYPAEAVTNLPAAFADADIISSATLATNPIIQGQWLRPGTHLDLIGAFRPDMVEADPECFARSSIFVDTMEGALQEAGDLIGAIAAGATSEDKIVGDLNGLCSGDVIGRLDSSMITLFKSVGTSIEDLVAADLVLERLGHSIA